MSSSSLTQKHCVPCEGGTAPLTNDQEEMYLSAVPNWQLDRTDSVHWLKRDIQCKNFTDCIDLVNKIAVLAESEGHHPDLRLHNYKQLEVLLTTHAIKGLSENDFIMAAKINELL